MTSPFEKIWINMYDLMVHAMVQINTRRDLNEYQKIYRGYIECRDVNIWTKQNLAFFLCMHIPPVKRRTTFDHISM